MELHIIYSLIAGSSIILISLIGVIFTWNSLGRWLEKNLSFLISFSAGVFLYIAYHLIIEAGEMMPNQTWLILGVLAGLIIFYLFDQILPESHHHHEQNQCQHLHSKIDGRKMLFGDSLHNIGDGVILVLAFAVNLQVGLITTLGILLHESLQEISEFFVLRQAGYSTKQALGRNLLVSTTIIIGIGLGSILSNTNIWLAPILAIAGGGFIYIVLVDLLPSLRCLFSEPKKILVVITLFIAGLTSTYFISDITHELGIDHDTDEHIEDSVKH